jgi:hypothetical protein
VSGLLWSAERRGGWRKRQAKAAHTVSRRCQKGQGPAGVSLLLAGIGAADATEFGAVRKAKQLQTYASGWRYWRGERRTRGTYHQVAPTRVCFTSGFDKPAPRDSSLHCGSARGLKEHRRRMAHVEGQRITVVEERGKSC